MKWRSAPLVTLLLSAISLRTAHTMQDRPPVIRGGCGPTSYEVLTFGPWQPENLMFLIDGKQTPPINNKSGRPGWLTVEVAELAQGMCNGKLGGLTYRNFGADYKWMIRDGAWWQQRQDAIGTCRKGRIIDMENVTEVTVAAYRAAFSTTKPEGYDARTEVGDAAAIFGTPRRECPAGAVAAAVRQPQRPAAVVDLSPRVSLKEEIPMLNGMYEDYHLITPEGHADFANFCRASEQERLARLAKDREALEADNYANQLRAPEAAQDRAAPPLNARAAAVRQPHPEQVVDAFGKPVWMYHGDGMYGCMPAAAPQGIRIMQENSRRGWNDITDEIEHGLQVILQAYKRGEGMEGVYFTTRFSGKHFPEGHKDFHYRIDYIEGQYYMVQLDRSKGPAAQPSKSRRFQIEVNGRFADLPLPRRECDHGFQPNAEEWAEINEGKAGMRGYGVGK